MAHVGAQSPISLTVTQTQAQLLLPEVFVRIEVAGSHHLAHSLLKSQRSGVNPHYWSKE